MMALLIEKDGKQTMGGIAAVRDAFVTAAGDKLAVLDARMSYGPGNTQVLEFSGKWCADGTAFHVTSDVIPAGAALGPHAQAMARKLIEEKG